MKRNRFVSLLMMALPIAIFGCKSTEQIAEPAAKSKFQWKKVGDRWQLAHPVYVNQLLSGQIKSSWGRIGVAEKDSKILADPYLAMSDDDLRKMIDETGIPPKGSTNAKARDAAYYLAQAYHDTGDKRYAHKAAVLFLRFSEAFPKWPFHNRGGKPSPREGNPVYYGSMWGSTWYYYDLDQPAVNIAKAWDLIQDSGEIEALGPDARKKIETDFLYSNVKIYTERYPRGFGNVDADLLYGIMLWGLVLNDPAIIHMGVRWAHELYRVSFYPSGAWHESTGTYLLMVGCRLDWAIVNNPLKGYSDPPGWRDPVDGTRYDNLDMEKELKPSMDEVASVMRNMTMPNGLLTAVHDSYWNLDPRKRSYMPAGVVNYTPTVQHPYVLFDFGHAIMAGGKGDDQSQVHLHFSGTHGHAHLDNLNIILYAKGKEIFSETAYESTADSTREWHTSTAGHNTVVIDQKSQTNTDYRTITALDAISEVPDYPLTLDKLGGWRHLSMNDGNLRLWEANHDTVQIAEASAEQAYYPTSLSIYRRTLSRIVSSGSDFYVVDIFRVKGGTTHDWMLHGNLEEAYTVETPLKLEPVGGKIHSYITLTKSLTTADPLEFRFVSPGGQIVRTLMAPAAGTQAMIGEGPAMRRTGKAQFLDIRRTGSTDIFAAVHEPYTNTTSARVNQLTQLTPLSGSSTNAVALKIELADRTDYFLSTMGPVDKVIVQDGSLSLSLTGHVGYVTVQDGAVVKLYLVDGSRLVAGGQSVTAVGYSGTVTGSYSKTALLRTPDAMNAFEVEGKLAEGEGLKGRTILLTDGEGATHGFEIASVASQGGKTLVTLTDDPGVQIRDGVYKMLFFPSWGVKGKVTYHVGGTALKEF